MDLPTRLPWQLLREPAVLRALAALPCALLAASLLRVEPLPQSNRARSWIHQGSSAAADLRAAATREGSAGSPGAAG